VYCPLDDPTPLPQAYSRAAPPLPEAPPLTGDVEADVAIVGGGFTGLCAGLHLAEAGRSVVLVEARGLSSGGSGRAFGQVVPYAKHDERHILRHFGQTVGLRLIAGLAGGPALARALIERHGIACNATTTGLLFAAHSPAAEAGLKARAAFWQERGVALELCDAARTAELVGSRYYAFSLLDRRGFAVNPLAYGHGLAAAAARAGVRLHGQSRATALAREGESWRVRTPGGSVRARTALLATGAYSDDLWPGLRSSVVPMRAHQLVSQPLSDNVRRTVLPDGQSLTDTRRLYSGMRLLPDGRLHMTADGPAFSPTAGVFEAKATRRVRDVFPQIDELRWDESWTGWVDMSGDQYPHLHALAPDLWAAIGLSGRGIAFATLLGRELAWRVLGRPEADFFMPVTPLKPILVRPMATPLVSALMTTYRVQDWLELRSRPAGR